MQKETNGRSLNPSPNARSDLLKQPFMFIEYTTVLLVAF